MKVRVVITKEFERAAKPLLKKYASLSKDLLLLERELIKNSRLGTPLGNNVYKIRLTISSKGRGKSGGARVISLVESIFIEQVKLSEDETVVNLITIYDKADISTISDKELKALIKAFFSKK